ncbi:MAG: hypothetical protein J6C55_04360, partial [Oscillospiraceae bacterium]|nr:hypothetical protein [Oscillospiraceae bacterium]
METTEPNYNNDRYEISSKEELYWFAKMINGEVTETVSERTTNAILTEDITINSDDVMDAIKEADGADNSGEALSWTPIGKDGTPYTGTFEGNNKTISGLYFN